MTAFAMRLLERDLVPDFVIRRRIRSLLAARLRDQDAGDAETQRKRLAEFIRGTERRRRCAGGCTGAFS
jgi:hypothetical protein